MTKIAKGECRGKRKFYFRMDYAEPHLIFVFTKLAIIGEIWKSRAKLLRNRIFEKIASVTG